MLTEKNRKKILSCVLETIEGVSSKGYQEMAWIRGEGPWVDAFDETVCNFFQEGDAVIEEKQEFKLTEDQFQKLKDFRNEFAAFCKHNHCIYEFIDSGEWTRIRELAKDVLQEFSNVDYTSRLPVVNEWVKQQEKRSAFEQGD
jgi:hypothetical protein